jgi:DNA recombination protein RmuC
MEPFAALVLVLGGTLVGALLCAAALRRLRNAELREARSDIARLRAEETTYASRLEELRRMEVQLRDTFKAISGDVLRANSEQFLQLARAEMERAREAARAELDGKETAIGSLLQPIRDGLASYDLKLQQIEKERTTSYAALSERLVQVASASESLRTETATLARALRSANVRGTWGEVQLRRVCELAGMLEHCDFRVQQSVDGEGGKLRPDLVVKLPGGRTIVVDAKTPLSAYLEAADCSDDARRRTLMKQHAVHVRRQLESLGRKSYWEEFAGSPEFVVLFLPAEAFFSAALEHDPALIEDGTGQGVLIATPTTLIALLKAVAYGWSQETLAQSAQEISDLGRELYDRLCTMGGHLEELGTHLQRTVTAYNETVGSIEYRVLPTARRFPALGAAAKKTLPRLAPVDAQPRPVPAELKSGEQIAAPEGA